MITKKQIIIVILIVVLLSFINIIYVDFDSNFLNQNYNEFFSLENSEIKNDIENIKENIYPKNNLVNDYKKKRISSCQIFKDNKVYFAHRGGNTNLHQDNTIEIFLDSAINKRSIEIDLMQLRSGEIIAFHDSNTLYRTGKPNFISQTSYQSIKNLTYLNNFEGKQYKSNPKIALLKDALEIICLINNVTNIWFDIKYSFDINYINELLNTLEASPCSCNENQILIAEVFRDLNSLYQMHNLQKNFRCKLFRALSYYDFQVELGYGYFEKELTSFLGWVDIIDFPFKLIHKYPNLLKINNHIGICNSIYGGNKNEVDLFIKDKGDFVNSIIYKFYED